MISPHLFEKKLKKKRGKLEKKNNFRKKIKNKWKKKWKVGGGENEKVQKKQKEEKVTKKRGMQCGLLFVIHNVLGVGEQWFPHILLKKKKFERKRKVILEKGGEVEKKK